MQKELLSIIGTVAENTCVEKNIFFRQWIKQYKENVNEVRRWAKKLQSLPVSINTVPMSINTVPVSIDDIPVSINNTVPVSIDDTVSAVLRVLDRMDGESHNPQILKTTISEYAAGLNLARDSSDRIFAPVVLHLENDNEELALLEHVTGTTFFRARYGSRLVLANFTRADCDTINDKMEYLMQQGDVIATYPNDFEHIGAVGTLYRGEVIFLVCIFFEPGVLFLDQPALSTGDETVQQDVLRCVEKYQTLNEIGCLHLQANRLLATQHTNVHGERTWRLLGPGLKVLNDGNEFFDASAFYVELFENHGMADQLPREFCRHLFKRYPLVLRNETEDPQTKDTAYIYRRHRELYKKWLTFFSDNV